jgi:RND family efflux transporter MFP subunit
MRQTTSQIGALALLPGVLALLVSSPRLQGQPADSKPLVFTGRLEAVQSVDVRPRVSGILTKVNFRGGSDIKTGDVLFEIDAKPYQLALERAEADARLAEARKSLADANFERAKKLGAAISQEELAQLAFRSEEAKALLFNARANVEMARLNLEFTKIRSPIDGRIGQAIVTEGNFVRADEPVLANVVGLDSLRAVFEMDERTFLRLQRLAQAKKAKRQSFVVSVRLADDQEIGRKATVDFVDNRLNPETGTIRVSAVIANPQGTLLPGLFIRIALEGDAGARDGR